MFHGVVSAHVDSPSDTSQQVSVLLCLVYRLSIYTRIYGRVGGGAALRSKKNEDTLNGHFHKRQQYTTVHNPYIHIRIYIYIEREREREFSGRASRGLNSSKNWSCENNAK